MNEGDAPAYIFVDMINGKLTVVGTVKQNEFDKMDAVIREARAHPESVMFKR